jgi:hypothetical protein
MTAITAPHQCSPGPEPGNTATRVLEAGLALIARDIPVFLCARNSKVPATEHGFQCATLDPEVFAAEVRRVPGGNLAIPTGPASGFDVLDVDHRADGSGWSTWRLLQAEGYLPEPLAIVRTPSGGGHFYYAASGRNSGRLPKHKLDFKAAGGYVLVPPSVVGAAYEWVKPL